MVWKCLEHVSPFKPWLAFGIHVRPVGPWMKTLSLHLNKFPSNRISQPIRDCHICPPTTSKLIVIQDPKRVKVSIKKKVNVSFDKEDRQQKSVRRCTAMPLDLIALCIVSYHFILLCCRIQIEADCATGSLLPWFAALKARLPKLPDGEDVDTRWP